MLSVSVKRFCSASGLQVKPAVATVSFVGAIFGMPREIFTCTEAVGGVHSVL
jgi:hypothetical protein